MEINELKGKLSYSMMVIGGTLLGVLLVGLVVVKPLLTTNARLTKEKNERQTQLTEMKKRLNVLNDLKDQEDTLKRDSETVTNALPTQEEIGRLFIQLDSIAKASGGNLRSVAQLTAAEVGSTSIKEQQYSIPLDMPSYFALKQFITNAESALSLLSISDIKIDGTDSGALTVNITAKAYSRSK